SLLLLLVACAPSPTPALIPAGPTIATTPAPSSQASPVVFSTSAPAGQATLTPRQTTAPPTPPPNTATATLVVQTSTPTPTDTSTPAPSLAPNSPIVLSFSINPTTTQRVGDRITFTWQAGGERAEICP